MTTMPQIATKQQNAVCGINKLLQDRGLQESLRQVIESTSRQLEQPTEANVLNALQNMLRAYRSQN